MAFLIKLSLKRSFPYNVLRRLIDADVDSTDVFADEAEQKHNHAADKEYSGEHTRVSNRNCREHQFFVNDKEACGKADSSAD